VWQQLRYLGYNNVLELISDDIEIFLELNNPSIPSVSTSTESGTEHDTTTAATATATAATGVTSDANSSTAAADAADTAVDDSMDTVEASETEPASAIRYIYSISNVCEMP
jgi:hypothetical protein